MASRRGWVLLGTVGVGLWLLGQGLSQVVWRVVLDRREAATGTTRKLVVRRRKLCARCAGTGRKKEKRCWRCQGGGLGRPTWHRVTLRIPAGVRDGTIVRVAGAGTPGVYSVRPAGDLRARVRIRRIRLLPRGRRSGAEKRNRPAAPGGGTIASRHVEVTVDATGLEVRRSRRPGQWETHLRLPWSEVRGMAFDTAPYDPVIAFYVATTGGRQHYAFDANHLSRQQWRQFADLVAAASSGRATVDLASHDAPHVDQH